jgi:hypothetical protein
VVEQGRLADAGRPAQHQHPTLARSDGSEEHLERRSFRPASEQFDAVPRPVNHHFAHLRHGCPLLKAFAVPLVILTRITGEEKGCVMSTSGSSLWVILRSL